MNEWMNEWMNWYFIAISPLKNVFRYIQCKHWRKDTCVDCGQFAHRDVPVAEGDCYSDDGHVDPDEEADEPADDRQALYVLRGEATKKSFQ